MIRLSLLPTSHPLSFQPKWVRSSTQYYPRFNLLMGRSPAFRVYRLRQCRAINTRFPSAPARKALTCHIDVTRRIIMQKARRHTLPEVHSAPTACRHTVSGSFPPLTGVLFIFHSRYLVSYRSSRVFSLSGMVPADSIQVSRDWTYSGNLLRPPYQLSVRDCHPLWSTIPDRSTTFSEERHKAPTTPRRETLGFGLVPLSLAATNGIDFSFFSSGYLDVSVRQVGLGIMGSMPVCRLPQAYRRLPRPFFRHQDIPRAPLVA